MKKTGSAVLICLLATPVVSQAQSESQTDACQPQALSIAARNATTGPLSRSAAPEAARLRALSVPAGAPTSQTQTRKKSGGHPVLKGTLIGAAIGGGFVALTCHAGSENECPYLFLGGVFGGAGIGAAVGGIIAIARR
jgi:hypothetical protein